VSSNPKPQTPNPRALTNLEEFRGSGLLLSGVCEKVKRAARTRSFGFRVSGLGCKVVSGDERDGSGVHRFRRALRGQACPPPFS